MNASRIVLLAATVSLLTACDYLGIQSGADQTAAREAEGKAIGGACRHAGRAIEDCYAYNPTAPKSAVFAGWKSMNDYMAENKLEVVPPKVEARLPGTPRRKQAAAESGEKGEAEKSAEAGHGADAGHRGDKADGSLARAKVSSR